MASNWPAAKLGEVIDLFDSQRVPLNSWQRQERQGKFPYYGAQGIIDHIDGYIFDGRYILVAEDGENLNSKKLPRALFATGKFWVNNHAHILRGKPGIADDTFLLACVNNADIKPFVTGAAQPKLSQGNLRLIEIPLPPLPVQQRIAGILSAYGELIENSQRRIKILEAMARALYREWFVHFRFPGHENHPRVASPLGEIPQGWEVTTLRAVTTKIGSGATPRGGKDAYKSEGIHLIRSLNIYDYNFEFSNLAFIDEKQAADLDNVTVEEDDILLNITGASVARCALVPNYLLPARVKQHVAIVRAATAKVSPFYLIDAINSDQRKQQLLALAQGGATREALTKDTISNFEIVLPPSPLMERYSATAGSIHRQREVLLRQIQNLRRTRDLLLPRLLSGQIDLEAAKALATA
jgi:type I restriction enzyme S subunit